MDIDLLDELEWIKQINRELVLENRELTADILRLENVNYSCKNKIEEFEKSHMGLQLSGALAEVDRLKQKCNRLNNKLKGKYIDE